MKLNPAEIESALDRLGVPYVFRTTPWAHQREAFERSKTARYFALLMEQRTGKTKVVYDTAALNYEHGRIDALLIVAWPSGVPRVWTDEAAIHVPERIPTKVFVWRSNRATLKSVQAEFAALLAFKGLAILAINCEALRSPNCRTALAAFLKQRKVLAVADETSGWAIHPGTLQSKALLGIGKHPNVVMKRILDGTPIEDGPLNLYVPLAFLDHAILGFTSFYAHKAFFGEWAQKLNHTTNQPYQELIKYKNLDVLKTRLDSCNFRVLRHQCADIPAKLYVKHYVQLTTEQRRVYDALRDEYVAELRGRSMSAALVLTRYLRLQQILSNRFPAQQGAKICTTCDGEGCGDCDGLGAIETTIPESIIDAVNPRLEALADILRRDAGPFIVWSRFTRDIDDIMQLGREMDMAPVRYDGTVGADDRALAIRQFQGGTSRLFVGNPKAGGRGVRLDAARIMIYFSNDFSLLVRLQSEDRAENLTRREGMTIIDIVAEDTIDEHIVQALRDKKKIADEITGDRAGEWL